MNEIEIKCQTPGGYETTLAVPYLKAADADSFYEVIGNDVMRKYYILHTTHGVPMSEVMNPWLDNLTTREFKQVKDICFKGAYFKEYPTIEVDFDNHGDDKKILSMVVYKNLKIFVEDM